MEDQWCKAFHVHVRNVQPSTVMVDVAKILQSPVLMDNRPSNVPWPYVEVGYVFVLMGSLQID